MCGLSPATALSAASLFWPPSCWGGPASPSTLRCSPSSGDGLSSGTYLVGKLLHGGLSALFIAVLVRLFPLEAPVSDYLADQVAGIAGMDFHRTLVISLVCAWVLFLFFLFVAAAAMKALARGIGACYNEML